MAIKQRKPIAEYFFSGVKMYSMTLLLSLFSMMFLLDVFPAWCRVLMGIVFTAPQFLSHYILGKKAGERAFKEAKALAVLNGSPFVKADYGKSVFHVLTFGIPLLIVLILALILKNLTLRAVVIILLFMPVTLFFWGVGALSLDVINWVSAVVFIPAILLYCGAFIYGYIRSILRLRRREGAIKSELRSFNN